MMYQIFVVVMGFLVFNLIFFVHIRLEDWTNEIKN